MSLIIDLTDDINDKSSGSPSLVVTKPKVEPVTPTLPPPQTSSNGAAAVPPRLSLEEILNNTSPITPNPLLPEPQVIQFSYCWFVWLIRFCFIFRRLLRTFDDFANFANFFWSATT